MEVKPKEGNWNIETCPELRQNDTPRDKWEKILLKMKGNIHEVKLQQRKYPHQPREKLNTKATDGNKRMKKEERKKLQKRWAARNNKTEEATSENRARRGRKNRRQRRGRGKKKQRRSTHPNHNYTNWGAGSKKNIYKRKSPTSADYRHRNQYERNQQKGRGNKMRTNRGT